MKDVIAKIVMTILAVMMVIGTLSPLFISVKNAVSVFDYNDASPPASVPAFNISPPGIELQ